MTADEIEQRQAIIDNCRRTNAFGTSLDKAQRPTVEAPARQDRGCLQIGEPPLRTVAEIERVRQNFAGYELSDTQQTGIRCTRA